MRAEDIDLRPGAFVGNGGGKISGNRIVNMERDVKIGEWAAGRRG